MKTTCVSRRFAPLCLLMLLAAASSSRTARAEIKIGEAAGWEAFTDGRINAFGSYATGDEFPSPTPLPANIDLDQDGNPDGLSGPTLVGGPFGAGTNQGDLSGNISATRIRSGFVSNVLAIGVKRKLNETNTLRVYVALWSSIETEAQRLKYNRVFFDIRQAFLQLQGPWGSLLLGRDLGIFSRAAVEINYLYQHAYGLGNPCGVDGNGPTCGHIGFGVIYPGFDPGAVYSTPSLGGLKFSIGIYDPVSLQSYIDQTPFPRPEGELVLERKLGKLGMFKLFANGVWQRIQSRPGRYPDFLPNGSMNTTMQGVKNDAWGVGAGGRLELGPMRFGGTGFTGVGLGTHYPIQHTPGFLFSTNTWEFRKFDGAYGTVAAVLGRFMLNAGFGIVRVYQLTADLILSDPANPFSVINSIPHYQYGISGGINARITDNLFLNIDVFKQHSQWHQLSATTPQGVVPFGGEKQDILFVNSGITFTW